MVGEHVRFRQFYGIEPHGVHCGHGDFHLAAVAQNLGAVIAQLPLHGDRLRLHRLVGDVQVDALYGVGVQVTALAVRVRVIQEALLFAGEQHRRKETLFIVVQRLPAAEVVDRRPRSNRPAVVQLPHDRAHALSAVTTPVLYAVLHRLGAQKLRGIQQRAKALRRVTVRLAEICHDLAVRRVIALMLLHNIGENISVFRLREGFDRFQRRERLEAELGNIAEVVVAVVRKRQAAVPNIPVVHVAARLVGRVVEVAAGGRA